MNKLFAVLMSLQLIIAPVALAQGSGDQFRENPDAKAGGGMDFYAKQVLAVGVSAIGADILKNCGLGMKLMSLKIFMGGSVVHIASEMLGGKAQNENHKKRAADIKMIEEKMKGTQGGDVQKEALEQALKEEKETLAFINKRKMWMMAVTAIYAAATGFAVMEMMKSKACMAAAPGAPASYTGPLAYCAISPWTPPTSGFGLCQPATKPSLISKLLPMAYTFGSSRIAEGGMIGTYGSYAVALAGQTKLLGGMITKSYNQPMARVITFGAATVLVGLVMNGLMDRAKVTQENIKKLESVLNNFNSSSQPNNALASSGQGGSAGAVTTLPNGGPSAINMLSDGSSLPRHCLSNTQAGMNYSTDSCKAPARLPGGGFDGSLNVPTLASAATLSNDMAQSVANGDIAAAETSAATLGAMAAKINMAKDNLVKQLNARLKSEGKPALDFDGEVNKQVQGMMSDFNSANGTNASLAGAGGSGLDISKEDKNVINKSQVNTASAGATIEVPSAAGGIITEGLVDDSSLPTSEVAAVDPNADYEYNEQDVSEKSDVSIFQQVSNRYLFQYKKLFQRDEPKEDAVK